MNTQNVTLNQAPLNTIMLDGKIKDAFYALYRLLITQTPVRIATSFGKDSSCITSLTLMAAARAVQDGFTLAPIVLSHGDTGIENPSVHQYAMNEIKKVQAYAKENNFDVIVSIAKPTLATSWAYRHIGSGKLVTYPMSGSKAKNGNGQSRDCSVSLKLMPQQRALNEIKKTFDAQYDKELVTIIGTRFEESESRKRRMTERGETADMPWRGENGMLHLSPICHWSTHDVWSYLNLALTRQIDTYSDMEDTFEIYESAGGSACAIEADMALGKVAATRGCGSRHGCSLCTVTTDQSMANMIDSNPDFTYMKGLNQFQQFLLNTQWDWSRRHPVGRTIKHGYLTIAPDTYSPAMLEEMLKYALTIDIIEREAAFNLDIEPRFQLIDMQTLIAIDADWSRYGLHLPFHALKIYRDIVNGARYPVPDIKPVARTPRPAARYVYVGDDCYDGGEYDFAGLNNPTLLSLEGCPTGASRVLPATSKHPALQILDVDMDSMFNVDEEGAEFVLMDMDHLIDTYHNDKHMITAGFMHYISLGTLTFAHSQPRKIDEILRRTAFRQHHGLTGNNVNIEQLLASSIDEKAMAVIRASHETVTNNDNADLSHDVSDDDTSSQMDLFAA